MLLNRVEIRNFRSIKEICVEFDPTCRVLVGINESGKSNILQALALLGEDFEVDKTIDLREPLPDEDPIEESYVNFIFKFEKEESDQLFELVSSKIISNVKNPQIISSSKKRLTVKELCYTSAEGLYDVDIIEEEKSYTHWDIKDKYTLLDGWMKPASGCPNDYVVTLKGQRLLLNQYRLVRTKDFPSIPDNYLEEASIEDFESLFGGCIMSITEENLPKSIFWEYDEKNLLPNSVSITEFSSNPDSCEPLKNMFTLAGIDDIKAGLEEARKGSDNKFQNYLDRVARKTTRHFRKVWKEYMGIEFSLKCNGDHIIPGIKEKNSYDFAKRSDGFKRFVTFLLMISVNVYTDNLNNTLLLIDEPDISLHPSGARYLRDELIKISKKNYVVYCTHSIFMIDSSDIARHYIVRKREEITSIEEAQASNIADEEVLYNALGHSVFANLKRKNIIFEGWYDKQLFRVGLKNAANNLQRKYKDVGLCHARGSKNIKTITPMIELANRGCLIVSDSDTPSKEEQKIYVREKGYGEWRVYQEVDLRLEAITGEDFIKNEFILKQINSVLSGSKLPPFDQSALPDRKGKLRAFKGWLISSGLTGDQVKDAMLKVKDSIFENLKPQHIEDSYMDFLKGIADQFLT